MKTAFDFWKHRPKPMSTLIEPLLSCLSRSLIKLLMSKKQGNPCHLQINPATDPNVVAIKKRKKLVKLTKKKLKKSVFCHVQKCTCASKDKKKSAKEEEKIIKKTKMGRTLRKRKRKKSCVNSNQIQWYDIIF